MGLTAGKRKLEADKFFSVVTCMQASLWLTELLGRLRAKYVLNVNEGTVVHRLDI